MRWYKTIVKKLLLIVMLFNYFFLLNASKLNWRTNLTWICLQWLTPIWFHLIIFFAFSEKKMNNSSVFMSPQGFLHTINHIFVWIINIPEACTCRLIDKILSIVTLDVYLLYVSIYLSMYMCMYWCMYARMYVRMYIFMYV